MKTIEDIVSRDSQTFDISEMVFVVKSHIEDVMGVSVDINFPEIPKNNAEAFLFKRNVDLLNVAFFESQKYFINKFRENEKK